MNTSEILNKAADLIEERGWLTSDSANPWGRSTNTPLCLEGAIAAVVAPDSRWVHEKNEIANLCPAGQAVRRYLDLPEKVDLITNSLWGYNDAPGRTAAEVIETLRAAAVIEAARESELAQVSS